MKKLELDKKYLFIVRQEYDRYYLDCDDGIFFMFIRNGVRTFKKMDRTPETGDVWVFPDTLRNVWVKVEEEEAFEEGYRKYGCFSTDQISKEVYEKALLKEECGVVINE